MKQGLRFIPVVLYLAAIIFAAGTPLLWALVVFAILVDIVWAFAIFAWCPGSCREWWMNYFNKDQRTVKVLVVLTDLVVASQMLGTFHMAVVFLLTLHLGWFSLTYYSAASYLLDEAR